MTAAIDDHFGIQKAFDQYLAGELDGWDLSDLVQSLGYKGFTVTSDLQLVLH